MDYSISIYLDKRTKKKNGNRAIKLRVYNTIIQKAKFYGLGLSINEKDFLAIQDNKVKVRGKNRELQIMLQEIENRGYKIAQYLSPFTFDQFEKKMFRNRNASINVKYHYNQKIAALSSNDQISTASNYSLSLKSLSSFLSNKKSKSIEELVFQDITPVFLNGYENYMVKELDKSRTTVSMYLRALRTIFNDAIASNDIKQDLYPFGKSLYRIPQPSSRKSALSREQLATLFNAKPQTQEQEKARDFWFFSYACNGMNIKDIALLRIKDIKNGALIYFRAKTIITKKDNLKEIKVFLNEFAQDVINKYSSGTSPKDFVFSILDNNDDPRSQQKKIKNFTRFINQHIDKLGQSVGFDFRISSYWARHSFATNAIRKGASMEFISEALNHSSLKTTKNYFAGFEDEKKKEFADSLMEF